MLTTYGDQWKGINLEDGQDGFYNKDKAKAQLESQSWTSKRYVQFPIHIDVPDGAQNLQTLMQSLKQTVKILW